MEHTGSKLYQIDRITTKYLPLLVIFETYVPIINAANLGKFPRAFSYVLFGVLATFSFLYVWIHRRQLAKQYPVVTGLCFLMALYVIVACVRLYFVPSPIYPFQRLALMCNFLSVGTIFMLMQKGVIGRTLRMWWRYVPWIVILSFPLIRGVLTLRSLFLTFFFIMLGLCLRKQLRGLSYCFLAFIAMFCVKQRMDYLFIIAPVTIFLMLKYNKFLTHKASTLIYHVMMCLPVVFLILGLSGTFNVLKFDDYIEGDYRTNTGESFKDDTRTELYRESIESAMDNNYVLWGRTPGYGYDSKFVLSRDNAYIRIRGVAPQRYSEVFMVNMLTWCGVIGILAWFIFYYWFGISTLKRARNKYIRALVLYVGVFWVLDWISNHFTSPDNTYMMLYIIVSICIQPEFRNMNDDEIMQYFRKMLK